MVWSSLLSDHPGAAASTIESSSFSCSHSLLSSHLFEAGFASNTFSDSDSVRGSGLRGPIDVAGANNGGGASLSDNSSSVGGSGVGRPVDVSRTDDHVGLGARSSHCGLSPDHSSSTTVVTLRANRDFEPGVAHGELTMSILAKCGAHTKS